MYMYVYVCACLCILHSCKQLKYSTYFSSPYLLLLNSKSWRSHHCSIVMYGEIPHSFIQMHSVPFIDTEQFIQSPRDGYLGGCSLLLLIVLQWIALCKYLFIVCRCIFRKDSQKQIARIKGKCIHNFTRSCQIPLHRDQPFVSPPATRVPNSPQTRQQILLPDVDFCQSDR